MKKGRLILIVDDEPAYRRLYADTLESDGFDTAEAESAEHALESLAGGMRPDMVISDMRMPGMDGLEFLRKAAEMLPGAPFLLITAYPDLRDAVKAMKRGAIDYLEKPVDLDELLSAVCDSLGVSQEPATQPPSVPAEHVEGMVFESMSMKSLLHDAFRVAKSEANVLLSGESGSGKEVLARFIHRCSPRSKSRFLALNCAAIPPTLLSSELFGHRKGAFTGATSERAGAFREAHGGTLFLDEIGEMPLELQVSLLRAIETKTVMPIGGESETPANARLVAASNKNLQDEVSAGRFRLDLFYRLNVVAFEMPPLRERPEDIQPLCRLFLSKDGRQRRLSPAAASIVMAHRWPGNVRELSNAMERASILSGTDVILPEHLPPGMRKDRDSDTAQASAQPHPITVQEAEAEAIKSALESTSGNRTKAAEILGISRRTLIYKIKRLGL